MSSNQPLTPAELRERRLAAIDARNQSQSQSQPPQQPQTTTESSPPTASTPPFKQPRISKLNSPPTPTRAEPNLPPSAFARSPSGFDDFSSTAAQPSNPSDINMADWGIKRGSGMYQDEEEDEELQKALNLSMMDSKPSGDDGDSKPSSTATLDPEWLSAALKQSASSAVSSQVPSNFFDDLPPLLENDVTTEDYEIAQAIALSLRDSTPSTSSSALSPSSYNPSDYETNLPMLIEVPEPSPHVPDEILPHPESDEARMTRLNQPADYYDHAEFDSVMWGETLNEEDKQRWAVEGIVFCDPSSSSSTSSLEVLDHAWWALHQTNGGPCGVLALLQCEILKSLIFNNQRKMTTEEIKAYLFNTPETELDFTEKRSVAKVELANAVGRVLARAAFAGLAEGSSSGVRVCENNSEGSVCCFVIVQDGGVGVSNEVKEKELSVKISTYLLSPNSSSSSSSSSIPLDNFTCPGGVLTLIRSLLTSRPPSILRTEFDAADSTLTATFGHSSQELLNLLLTGHATSNTFDKTIDIGGMKMKGVMAKSNVGYLTMLEALSYCKVGAYFKDPSVPIWIVGGQGHFTVLFSLDYSCYEIKSREGEILRVCRKEFVGVDTNDCGFIERKQFDELLKNLNVYNSNSDKSILKTYVQLNKIAGMCEEGGIILWDGFWKVCSRLLNGESYESVTTVSQGNLQSGDTNGFTFVGGGNSSNVKHSSSSSSSIKFALYHYNGLRSGKLSNLNGTPLSSQSYIGTTVPLSTTSLNPSTSGSAYNDEGVSVSKGARELEMVCRTRWENARFEWGESGGWGVSID